jgi:hypothetical protein
MTSYGGQVSKRQSTGATVRYGENLPVTPQTSVKLRNFRSAFVPSYLAAGMAMMLKTSAKIAQVSTMPRTIR